MEVGKLTVEFRGDTGKTAVRQLRAAGKVPGDLLRRVAGEPIGRCRSISTSRCSTRARSGQEDEHRAST